MNAGTDVGERGWVVHAGFWRRFLAYFVDWFLITLLVSALTSPTVIGLPFFDEPLRFAAPETIGWVGVNWIVWMIYDAVMHARVGGTLGKLIVGVEVRAAEGARLSWGRSVARALMKFTLSAWVIYLGYLWAAWDPAKQAWHDKLARSYVVTRAAR